MEKNSVLSEQQKLVLATLYQAGIRGISYQKTDFALYNKEGLFAGNFCFDNNKNFDFRIFEKYMMLRITYYLSNIIENFAPEYIDILD